MSDEALRTANRRALWAALAITLGPLAVMPLASRNAIPSAPAQIGAQTSGQSGIAGIAELSRPRGSV